MFCGNKKMEDRIGNIINFMKKKEQDALEKKEKKKEYDRLYRLKNREKHRQYCREYYEKNREHILERKKEYYKSK